VFIQDVLTVLLNPALTMSDQMALLDDSWQTVMIHIRLGNPHFYDAKHLSYYADAMEQRARNKSNIEHARKLSASQCTF